MLSTLLSPFKLDPGFRPLFSGFIWFYILAVRFGSVRFPNCRFLGGFRFARFGSRFAVRFANLPVHSRAHFADFIFQKCSAHLRFLHFDVQIELSLAASVLCTFCWQLSQIEPRTRGNRDPTSATPGATLPHQKVMPGNVFTREFTCSRTVTRFYFPHTRSALAHCVVQTVMT